MNGGEQCSISKKIGTETVNCSVYGIPPWETARFKGASPKKIFKYYIVCLEITFNAISDHYVIHLVTTIL